MVYADDFICDNDSSVIQGAIENRNADGIVVITPVAQKQSPKEIIGFWTEQFCYLQILQLFCRIAP